MSYFKINGNDYSMYVNKLKVSYKHIYKSAANANGNTTVKYINTKRTIEVGIIPLDSATMTSLQADINQFRMTVSYLDPETGVLEEDVTCIVPDNSVEYYTVQANNVKFKAFSIKLTEL